ncbi:MAG: response regulator [Chitinophagales bacterium]|nr:response regulator [Chitinophagales bacterium]
MTEKTLKVLLIEDNPGDAFLIKFYLGESVNPQFETHHAETIKQAFELLNQNHYDIILQDLNLPDSLGIASVKNLLEKYPGNLVLVLTGLSDEELGLETVRYGAQDFLVKGKFDGKVLISTVLFAYERFKLNTQLSKYQEEIDIRRNRFDNLQKFLNIGVTEIHKNEDKVFISSFAKKLLHLENVEGNFFPKETFTGFFTQFPNLKETLPKKATIESAGGVLAFVEFQEFDDKILGVIRLS